MPVINGSAGADTLTGTDHDDIIEGHDGDDVINGGWGDDQIWDGAGDDAVDGGYGSDEFYGSSGNDVYEGGASEWGDFDRINYIEAAAAVVVDLGASADHARSAGAGDAAGIGVDQLINIEDVGGSNFDDLLSGNSGSNVLLGFAGDDVLSGRGGDDALAGSAGNDVIDGGDGIDIAVYASSSTAVRVSLASAAPQDTGQGVDTLTNVENLRGSYFGDHLTGDDASNQIFGHGGQDEIFGGAGNDELFGTGRLFGETGDDRIRGGGRLDGGAGDDRLDGSSTDDQLFGGEGADVLFGGVGDDYLDGGAGADFMSGAGSDLGTEGNDTYVVDHADDRISEVFDEPGIDHVLSSVSFSLNSAERVEGTIENLTLTGSADIAGSGNDHVNVITGNSGDNCSVAWAATIACTGMKAPIRSTAAAART